jgi:hypothetical protein
MFDILFILIILLIVIFKSRNIDKFTNYNLPSYFPYIDEKTYLQQKKYNQLLPKNPININDYIVSSNLELYYK